jgi:hypothetical protein
MGARKVKAARGDTHGRSGAARTPARGSGSRRSALPRPVGWPSVATSGRTRPVESLSPPARRVVRRLGVRCTLLSTLTGEDSLEQYQCQRGRRSQHEQSIAVGASVLVSRAGRCTHIEYVRLHFVRSHRADSRNSRCGGEAGRSAGCRLAARAGLGASASLRARRDGLRRVQACRHSRTLSGLCASRGRRGSL